MPFTNVDPLAEVREAAYNQWVIEKLEESEKEAADPNTTRLSHEEVFGRLRE